MCFTFFGNHLCYFVAVDDGLVDLNVRMLVMSWDIMVVMISRPWTLDHDESLLGYLQRGGPPLTSSRNLISDLNLLSSIF